MLFWERLHFPAKIPSEKKLEAAPNGSRSDQGLQGLSIPVGSVRSVEKASSKAASWLITAAKHAIVLPFIGTISRTSALLFCMTCIERGVAPHYGVFSDGENVYVEKKRFASESIHIVAVY